MNGFERLQSVLAGKPADRLPLMPITMMFAARQLGIPYRPYAVDHRQLVAAQIHVAERFDFDHVSCISETREAEDCGAVMRYFDDQSPAIDPQRLLLEEKSKLLSLPLPDPREKPRMRDRIQAAELFCRRVKGARLIEGWIEGPCADAADLRGLQNLMLDFYEDPPFVGELFEFSLQLGQRFALAQIEAGVDLVGIGDAAASLVGPEIYRRFIYPYEKRLVDFIHDRKVPVRLHICGDISHLLADIAGLGCDIVDLDWLVSLARARRELGEKPLLLGNINPVTVLLNGTPELVEKSLAECHGQAGRRYIVGAGCEIPRDTPPENVLTMTRFAQRRR